MLLGQAMMLNPQVRTNGTGTRRARVIIKKRRRSKPTTLLPVE